MHEGMRRQDVQAAKGCLHDYAALIRWQAAWQPQKVFLVADEEKLTYDALWRRVAAMAVEASFLGVRGDILVLADDFIGQLVSFLALQAIGARPIPVSYTHLTLLYTLRMMQRSRRRSMQISAVRLRT